MGNPFSSTAPEDDWEYQQFTIGQCVRTRVSGEGGHRGTVLFENLYCGDLVGVRLDGITGSPVKYYEPYNLELLSNRSFHDGDFSFHDSGIDTDIVEVVHATGTGGCPHTGSYTAKQRWIKERASWPDECCLLTKNKKGQWTRCRKPAYLGAHVFEWKGAPGMSIVPCCSRHNPDTHLQKYGHTMRARKSMIVSLPNCNCQYTAKFPGHKYAESDVEEAEGDDYVTSNFHAIDLCRVCGQRWGEGPENPSKCTECREAKRKRKEWKEARPQRKIEAQAFERDWASRESKARENGAMQQKRWERKRTAALERHHPEITSGDLLSARDLYNKFKYQTHSKSRVLEKEVNKALDKKKKAKKKAQEAEAARAREQEVREREIAAARAREVLEREAAAARARDREERERWAQTQRERERLERKAAATQAFRKREAAAARAREHEREEAALARAREQESRERARKREHEREEAALARASEQESRERACKREHGRASGNTSARRRLWRAHENTRRGSARWRQYASDGQRLSAKSSNLLWLRRAHGGGRSASIVSVKTRGFMRRSASGMKKRNNGSVPNAKNEARGKQTRV